MTAEDVTLAIKRPSETPSVFVVASFTEPAWEPVQLDVKPLNKAEDGKENDEGVEYEFSKGFKVPEGSHQYRFRLGTEDSWICNESIETGEWVSNS